MSLLRLIKAKTGYKNYTKENLEEAKSLIEKGLSVYKASKLTDPISILYLVYGVDPSPHALKNCTFLKNFY